MLPHLGIRRTRYSQLGLFLREEPYSKTTAGMPSPKRHGHSRVAYKDDDGASSDDGHHRQKSNRPRGYGSPRAHLQRDNSLITLHKDDDNNNNNKNSHAKAGESDWDTDYDPRDRCYLSEEDDGDPLDLYSPAGKASSTPREEPSTHDHHHHSSSRRHRSTDHGSSSTTRRDHSPSQSHTRSHHHSNSHSHSHSHSHAHLHSREDDDDDDDDDGSTSRHHTPGSSRHKASTHKSTTASRPRPKPSRAGSSYLTTGIYRPRAVRAGSSSYIGSRSAARPRPRPRPPHTSRSTSFGLRSTSTSQPNKSVKAGSKPWHDFAWSDAAKVAVQAGTVAAIKVGTDSIPWPVKGTKIASAALGAAVVDHVLKPKKKGGVKYAAMRHLAEVAVGNLVVGPALGRAAGGGGGGGGGGGNKGGGRRGR